MCLNPSMRKNEMRLFLIICTPILTRFHIAIAPRDQAVPTTPPARRQRGGLGGMKLVVQDVALLFLSALVGGCELSHTSDSVGRYPESPVQTFEQGRANDVWRNTPLWECSGILRTNEIGPLISLSQLRRQMDPCIEVRSQEGLVRVYLRTFVDNTNGHLWKPHFRRRDFRWVGS